MKTRLSLLLLCSTLFASFAGADRNTDYSWTVINSDKEVLAQFLYFDAESDKVVLEKNNRKFTIPFERLTKNCKERVVILDNQQILQGQIKLLEQKISRLDKLAGEAIGRLDVKLQKIEADIVNANPVAQRQKTMTRTAFDGEEALRKARWQQQEQQRELEEMQRQMEIIKFNQMSGGPDLLIP